MIRELRVEDAEAYRDFRREALLDSPLAFASSPSDDEMFASLEAVRRQLERAPESVIVGAYQPQLCGIVGFYRDPHIKSRHKAYLWGLYVTPGQRRNGIATELVQTVLRHARALPDVSWVHLTVSAAAPAAKRLYERAGFRAWGAEPDALRHEGRSVAIYHMALRLE